MELGAFSISLNVKDIGASKSFYEKLGFNIFAGDISQNWQVMKNGDHIIGLFQGILEKNTLTFNPGWDQSAGQLDSFTDIRDIQNQLKSQGLDLTTEVDASTSGAGSLIVLDPDGNPILFDQHVQP